MKFKSAVDIWFFLLTLVALAVILIYIVSGIDVTNTMELIIISVTAIFVLGIPIWLLLSTYSLVESGILKIRSGSFNWSIPLNEINLLVSATVYLRLRLYHFVGSKYSMA